MGGRWRGGEAFGCASASSPLLFLCRECAAPRGGGWWQALCRWGLVAGVDAGPVGKSGVLYALSKAQPVGYLGGAGGDGPAVRAASAPCARVACFFAAK